MQTHRDIVRRSGRSSDRALWRSPVAVVFVLVATLLVPQAALAVTDPPGFVSAEAVRGHIVVVNWEPPLTPYANLSYFVYRAEGPVIPAYPGPEWTELTGGLQIGQYNTSFIDDDPKRTSTQYFYLVSALQAGDTTSTVSPTGNGLTERYLPRLTPDVAYQWYIGPTTRAPLEPTGLVAMGADNSITLSWNPVPSTNVATYRIYRADRSGEPTPTLIASVSATQTAYLDTSIEMYRHYWYRVSAVDSEGAEGSKSLEKHFRSVASTSPLSPHAGGDVWNQGSDTCAVCHDLHDAMAPKLLNSPSGTDEVALCLSCHDGTGSAYDVLREYADPHLSSHEVTVTASDGSVLAGTFGCVDCHEVHRSPSETGNAKLLDVDGVTSGNGVCYGSGCHGPGETTHWAGDMSGYEGSAHNSDIQHPESGTGVHCSTCHQPHSSPNAALWTSTGYRSCFQCHAGEGASVESPDIYTRLTANADHDSHHDVLDRDQEADGTFMACQNCHNTHSVTAQSPLVNPENPSMQGSWSESRTAPLAVAGGTADEPRYNAYCFVCHDGSLPTAAQTGNWVKPPLDNPVTPSIENTISELFVTNSHGAATSKGTPVLDPATGYTLGDTLSCMTCHEPHGTINNYNLRSDVLGADGNPVATGRLLVKRLDETGAPTGVFDTRFFCASCHRITTESPPDHRDATKANQPKNLEYFPNGCSAEDCHAHTNTQRGF